MGLFNDLSFSFEMDLFRSKTNAEIRKDAAAIDDLKIHYPDLFSEEFQEFIENLKVTMEYLDKKYGENFSSIFDSNKAHAVRNIN